jgi:molybdenum cofactor cytidylyltransferase
VKFGALPLAEAQGAALAHSIVLPGRGLKKGRVLTAPDLAALKAAGHATVVVAKLEPGDVGENEAAAMAAEALAAPGVTIGPAFTGRVNFYADSLGLCVVDRAAVDRFNLVDESVTLATVEPYTVVAPKQMVATVKIIPFAVRGEALAACATAARAAAPVFRVAPFRERHVALIQTRLPGLKESVLDKTVTTTRDRLVALGGTLIAETRCAHDELDLAEHIRVAIRDGADLVLVAGASAIIDRRDVIPAALTRAGGEIVHFGMPVDPGNLILMGKLGDVDVLGLPGCARSPKVNGYDWVLQRLCAGLPAGPNEIMRMGVGGLLAEIPTRGLPRAAVAAEAPIGAPRAPHIAAVILAAGRSTRMGTVNKLTIAIEGKPMVRAAAEAALASQARPAIVVTGHQREAVEAALKDLPPLRFVHNPDYAQGLSTSMKAGLAGLPADSDGAVVLLGDMPRIAAAEIDKLIAAFNPVEGRAIVVPTRKGQRGNPVLLGKQMFLELARVEGDSGARAVIAAHPDLVAEVEMDSDGVLTDIDTPQALAKLTAARPKQLA